MSFKKLGNVFTVEPERATIGGLYYYREKGLTKLKVDLPLVITLCRKLAAGELSACCLCDGDGLPYYNELIQWDMGKKRWDVGRMWIIDDAKGMAAVQVRFDVREVLRRFSEPWMHIHTIEEEPTQGEVEDEQDQAV